ncbi:methyl-accepting chemotaxis protein [Paenibacillus castaneae]|uniref:methyl-accepting chemotaxis protein n=1 Tax=Paenibacillus castaneae TaxID=474957 RepID=UPI000C9AD32F|nr:HAMP domain-containing methyl-accepting chemotaxis protein [Paenibacillus castaneae]NIK80563.1 methyl-accepting chemotaxis protein [Paenibacillus castaneae]
MRNFSIRIKLLLGFISILLIMALIIIVSIGQLQSVNSTYAELINDKTAKMLKIKNMVSAVKSEQVALRGYIIERNDKTLKSLEDSHSLYVSISNELAPTLYSQTMKDLLVESDTHEKEYFNFTKQIIDYKRLNNMLMITNLLTTQGPIIVNNFEKAMNAMESKQQNDLDTGIADAAKHSSDVSRLLIISGIISIILGLAIAIFIGRLITNPIIAVSRAAEKIAAGDLTGDAVKMNNKDELGVLASSFNMMSNNLRSVITQIGSNAEQVAASSEELTANSEQTSVATEQIAKAMQEFASGIDLQVKVVGDGLQTINEMSIGFQQIAENTQNVSAKAAEASEKAVHGHGFIQTAVEQMNSISETVNGLAEVVGELGSQSEEISQIVQVITELSAQTNLLSLNAAIEAARAGEHGRGFEVVATEVRKLSHQSSESAQQISNLIFTIQMGMDRAVQSMEAVTKEVKSGIEIVHTAGQSFEYIQEAVTNVAAQSEEVSASVQEMTAGVDEMTGSMRTITQVTESSAAGTKQVSASTEEQSSSLEEITSASRSLAKMAEDLQETISRFKTR